MAKIIIINTPYGYVSGRKPNLDDRGYMMAPFLPYLAEACERCGIETHVVDLPFEPQNLEELLMTIKQHPDCKMVALSATTCSASYGIAIALAVRKYCPDIKIVVGGPHFAMLKREYQDSGIFDYIIDGEGEYWLPRIYMGIFGIRDSDKLLCKLNAKGLLEMKEFDFPKYSYIKNWDMYNKTASINTARGCHCRCTYCLIPQMNGYGIRWRSAESVIEEIKYLVNQGVTHIDFTDPFLTFNKKRMRKICNLLIDKGIEVKWSGATRLDSVDEDLLKLMVKAGCYNLLFGIESANQESLSLVQKGLNISILHEKLDMVVSTGMTFTPSFIIGLPGESEKSMRTTLETAKTLNDKHNLNGDFQFNTLAIYPGSNVEGAISQIDLKEIDLDYAFFTIVPQNYNSNCSYEKHLEVWHDAWKICFPEFYDDYCRIEKEAFAGENSRLQKFMGNTIDNEILHIRSKSIKYIK